MLALVTSTLALLSDVASIATTSATIAKAIKTLTDLVPAIVQTGKDLVPIVKSTIEALRSNGNVTNEQLDELDALEAKIDAEFEAAAAAATAEDAAAEKSGS